jgi:magnesium-transporting ATPase (P-type)
MTRYINQYLILNNSNYFAVAEEFTILDQLFKQDTVFEKLNFWIDMVIYPIINLISIIVYNQRMGIFTIISIHKTVTKWQQYIRYLQLKSETNEWKEIVNSIGGPSISTNDDTYIMYVFADAMQRLRNRLFPILSKKGTKSL